MKNLCFFFVFLCSSSCLVAQADRYQIEITSFVRLDWYPTFSTPADYISSTDYFSLKGTSFGLNANYKIPVAKSIILKPGIGYYQYSFNNIEKENSRFGKSVGRDIDFNGPVFMYFSTDKYRYHTITANIGLEKTFILKRDIQFTTGINLNNYFSISEYYHLTYNPEGSKDLRTNEKEGYFGSSVYISIGFLKKFEGFHVGPSFILPLFDTWKTDAVFPRETDSGSRNKWLRGIGVGISLNYSLHKNR